MPAPQQIVFRYGFRREAYILATIVIAVAGLGIGVLLLSGKWAEIDDPWLSGRVGTSVMWGLSGLLLLIATIMGWWCVYYPRASHEIVLGTNTITVPSKWRGTSISIRYQDIHDVRRSPWSTAEILVIHHAAGKTPIVVGALPHKDNAATILARIQQRQSSAQALGAD